MSSQPAPDVFQDFFRIAANLRLLGRDAAQELEREAAAGNVSPPQLVLRKGLLDAVQVDIVEALLNPADTVPGYEILDFLGKGGMGVVYRARQQNLDRTVALKTILVSQMGDASAAGRFEQEAMTVARLTHPNIVAAYDFGRQAGRLYFVMELVEGEDAEALIRRNGRLDEVTALGLARQAAAGLLHAARAGVVHRDIKPANLLLVPPPEGFALPKGLPMVKIADFGLAFLTSSLQGETRLTAANTTLGSPHYMAPEQICGETVDHRADIYALGATLYHMLSGRPPFEGKTLAQIIAQKLSGEIQPLLALRPDLTTETTKLVADMMHRDPQRRIADYDDLIERIDHLAGRASATSSRPDQAEDTRTTFSAIEQTVLLPRPAQARPRIAWNRKRWAWLGSSLPMIVAGVLVGVAFWLPSLRGPFSQPPSVKADMVASGWSEPLFDGETLGALPASGVWQVAEDNEGAFVIAGSGGMIRRSLVRRDLPEPRPLENFRLVLFVRLHEASAVELHFAIESGSASGGEPCSVFRITGTAASLGHRRSNSSQLESVELISLDADPDKLHDVTLERQRGHWWVRFDGELVGTVGPTKRPQIPEFRMLAEGGPAWFSDLEVEELVEPGA